MIEKEKNSVNRFSDRVEDYTRHRPDYPIEVLEFLRNQVGLIPSHIVADIGSGTGIFSELLLKNGNPIYAVEPNAEMRKAARKKLSHYPKFHPVKGTAEQTTLGQSTVDVVACAQSFHWFDPERSKNEFKRIIRLNGKVVLVWNLRKSDGSEFLTAYEKLVRTYGTDYCSVRHQRLTENGTIHKFFGLNKPLEFWCHNHQFLDFDGLKGRLLSSSYAPRKGQPNHEPMMKELSGLFEKYQNEGRVCIEYRTEITAGELDIC